MIKNKIFIRGGMLTLGLAMLALISGTTVEAKLDLPEGTVFKGKNNPTLYYLSEDGKRYVFPNEKTYKSWYEDFNNVVEVADGELGTVQLGGNVIYKPGVYLIKITTDPKVYAVSGNGRLRWVKSEALAKKLYGENWNLLVDDVADAFFVNYSIDDPIESEDEFDPAEEDDDTISIDTNRKALKHAIKKVKKHIQVCNNLEKQYNKLQVRLAGIGIQIDDLGDEFLQTCVEGSLVDDDDGSDDDGVVKDGKARICHIPDGKFDNRHTITIAKSAVKEHLTHGDRLGICQRDSDNDDDDDDTNDDNDTTAPVISNKSADPGIKIATITWTTNEPATSKVFYATSTPVLNSNNWKMVQKESLVTNHNIVLEGLKPATLYYYLVKSADKTGNLTVSEDMSFTTDAEVIVDNTAPSISDILATATSTSAIITWSTNETSTSKVYYATSNLAGALTILNKSSDTRTTNHSVKLTELATSTTYYFKVESKDESQNTASSVERTFTTL